MSEINQPIYTGMTGGGCSEVWKRQSHFGGKDLIRVASMQSDLAETKGSV